MSDQRPGDDPDRPMDPEPGAGPDSAAAGEASAVERRAFLRQLTGEAVVTSARLAGLSQVMRRTLFAAAESATREVDPAGGEPADAPPAEVAPALPGPAVPATPAAPVAAIPSAALTSRQEAFLTEAASAVLGTNDAAGAPHLTASRFHWDGEIVRLPSDLFSARVERIGADPRVSLLVADDGPDAWVAINGSAAVISGDPVEAGMLTILRKYMSDDEADRSWSEMRSDGEPVVIEVRPSRYLWRFR